MLVKNMPHESVEQMHCNGSTVSFTNVRRCFYKIKIFLISMACYVSK